MATEIGITAALNITQSKKKLLRCVSQGSYPHLSMCINPSHRRMYTYSSEYIHATNANYLQTSYTGPATPRRECRLFLGRALPVLDPVAMNRSRPQARWRCWPQASGYILLLYIIVVLRCQKSMTNRFRTLELNRRNPNEVVLFFSFACRCFASLCVALRYCLLCLLLLRLCYAFA